MSDYHNPYMDNADTFNAFEEGYQQGRADAIEEFKEKLRKKVRDSINDTSESQRTFKNNINYVHDCSIMMGQLRDVFKWIDEVSEQIKEQKNE